MPLANWNAHPRDVGITLGSQKSWIPGEYTATDNICHFGTRNKCSNHKYMVVSLNNHEIVMYGFFTVAKRPFGSGL